MYIYIYIYVHIYIYTSLYIFIYMHIYASARPYESCNFFEGLASPRSPFGAGTTVVFSLDHHGHVEMKNPTRLSNKTSTA